MIENNQGDNRPKKSIIYYYFIILVVVMLLNALFFPSFMEARVKEVGYSDFITMVDENKVTEVVMDSSKQELVFSATDENGKTTYYKTGVFPDDSLMQRLTDHNVKYGSETVKQNSSLLSVILTWLLPIFIFIGIGQLISKMMMKKMGGGPAMTFGKANAKIYAETETGVTFDDVAGEEDSKDALT